MSRDFPLNDITEFFLQIKTAEEETVAPASSFAASPEEVVALMQQLVTHEFKMHQWYSYYSAAIRGPNREGASRLFKKLAPLELEDATYFLRRINAIVSTPLPVNPVPSPAPESSPERAVAIMLAEENRAILLLQHLRSMLGDDPMVFNVEQMISDEQAHADQLLQLVPATKSKTAAAEQMIADEAGVQLPATAEVVREQLVGDHVERLTVENADLKKRLMETSQMAAHHMEAAEQAIAGQHDLEARLQEQEQATLDATATAQQAQSEAADAVQMTTQESDKKMRLAIRIQQMRQQLADMVATDPVTEEGADAPPISTAEQQQQQMMMEAEAAAAQPAPKDKKPTSAGAAVAPMAPAAPAASAPAPKVAAFEGESDEARAKRQTREQRMMGAAGSIPGAAVGGLAANMMRPSNTSTLLGAIVGAGLGYAGTSALQRRNHAAEDLLNAKARELRAMPTSREILGSPAPGSHETRPAVDWGDRLRKLQERRDPKGVEKAKEAALIAPVVAGAKRIANRGASLLKGSQVAGLKAQANSAAQASHAWDKGTSDALRNHPKVKAMSERLSGRVTDAMKAVKSEERKVLATRVGTGVVGAGGLIGTGAAAATAARPKEAGLKSFLASKAEDAGAAFAKGISDSPEASKLKRRAVQGLAAAAAVPTATSIYQGNKTRAEIRKGRE